MVTYDVSKHRVLDSRSVLYDLDETAYRLGTALPVLFVGDGRVVYETGEQVPLDLPDTWRGPYADPWGWAGADVLMVELAMKNSIYPCTCRPSSGSCQPLPRGMPMAYPR